MKTLVLQLNKKRRNMRTKVLLLALAALFSFGIVSCNKDDDPGNEPTHCANGVLDGDETGVDCGGSCDDCSTGNTCNNGVRDGDETGVDCGGSCDDCIPNITAKYYFLGKINDSLIAYQFSGYLNNSYTDYNAGTCDYSLGGGVSIAFPYDAVDVRFEDVLRGYPTCSGIKDTVLLKSLFPTGTYDFEDGNGPSGSDIYFRMELDEVTYDTDKYSNQDASAFLEIIEVGPDDSYLGFDAVKVKIQFNCKIENANGDVLNIEDAEMVFAIYDAG